MNAKKKALVIMFLAVLVLPLFAQEENDLPEKERQQTHFLLGLDGNILFASLESGGAWFGLSGVPFVDAEFQLPINSDFKMYLGVKAFSVIAVNCFQVITRLGYAFERPQNWTEYHVELLGSLGTGIMLGLIEFVSVLPWCETSFQVYLMPEKRGFFAGFGPQAAVLIVPHYHSIDCLFTLGFELSLGFKF